MILVELSIGKKTLWFWETDSQNCRQKGRDFSYKKIVENEIKGFWEICQCSPIFTHFVQTFSLFFCHITKAMLCAKAFTGSALPFWEYIIFEYLIPTYIGTALHASATSVLNDFRFYLHVVVCFCFKGRVMQIENYCTHQWWLASL